MDIFDIRIHPAADVFPMLDEESLAELADDIAANGLRDPLVLQEIEGEVVLVDGRNRRAACKRLGVVPEVRYLNGEDTKAFIVSTNINRRHMTKGQKAMALAQLYPEPTKLRRKGASPSETEGLSSAHLSMARTVYHHAKDLIPAVMAGYSLDDAYKQALDYKRRAESVEARIAGIRDAAPDIATMVEEGRLSIEAGEAEIRSRQEKERQRISGLNQAVKTMATAFEYISSQAGIRNIGGFIRDEKDKVADGVDAIGLLRSLRKQIDLVIKEATHAD